MVKTVEVEHVIDHPLEKVFDIEENTTVVTRVEAIPTEVAVVDSYDEKDVEVETQFQEVYDTAMAAFEATTNSIESIEPKFRARNEEVAVQYLNTALAAAREKSVVKQHKDKLSAAKSAAPSTVNNNFLVADRNEILRNFMEKAQRAKVVAEQK